MTPHTPLRIFLGSLCYPSPSADGTWIRFKLNNQKRMRLKVILNVLMFEKGVKGLNPVLRS